MNIEQAFAAISTAFPSVAEWQGMHFRFAHKNNVTLIEKRRYNEQKSCHVFFYWLIWEGNHKLIHAAQKSKLAPMRTIGDSFSPSHAY